MKYNYMNVMQRAGAAIQLWSTCDLDPIMERGCLVTSVESRCKGVEWLERDAGG